MALFNPITFEFEKVKKSVRFSKNIASTAKYLISVLDVTLFYEPFNDISCNRCNSVIPTETQLKSHKISCTGRTSFMRLINNHPEYHSESEVFWIIRQYINKQIKQGKNHADMPIGTKYLVYADLLEKMLKLMIKGIVFKILYKTNTQIMVRCSW
jgi:hypothetical protein